MIDSNSLGRAGAEYFRAAILLGGRVERAEAERDTARAEAAKLREALTELADSFATLDASNETNDKVRAALASGTEEQR